MTARGALSADTGCDGYDEGLVHGHGWASSGDGFGGEQTIAQAEQQPQAALREEGPESHDEGDAYDDGLVHGHGWASSR